MKLNLKSSFIGTLIIIISFSYYADLIFLNNEIDTISILGYEIGGFGFPSFNDFVFFAKMKLYPILLLIIWYLTSRSWWKNALLLLIFIDFLKLVSIFNPNADGFDEIEILFSLPISIPFIVLLIVLSRRINYLYKYENLKDSIDLEIEDQFSQLEMIERERIASLRKKFNELKNRSNSINSEAYIRELQVLKNRLYDEI